MTTKETNVAKVIFKQIVTCKRDVLIKGKRKFIDDNIYEIKKNTNINSVNIAKIKMIYSKCVDKLYPNYPK